MSGPVLNRKLTLQEAQKVTDEAGGFTETWVDLGSLWAEVKPRTGRERARARKGVGLSRVDYRITVRAAEFGAPSRPVAGQRFREGTRLFRILAVTEQDSAARFLTCFATEEIVA
ncbi:head-tail adaptor protein [Cognatishimia sp. WU-CL00825]|uniref:phage head closure protein n=1 Tax=Cognatishimia sp. WU-CL00825 TaxID=3127658 RepID=UPI0031081497